MTSPVCTRDDPYSSMSLLGGDACWWLPAGSDTTGAPVITRLAPVGSPPDERDPLPQTLGQGSITTYDAWRRTQYTGTIKHNAGGAVSAIEQAEVQGNLTRAEQIAHDASDARNAVRTSTQGKLTPGGRVISEMLEQDRSWPTIVNKYSQGAEPDFAAWKRVASATGRSSRDMVLFTRMSKVLGPVGMVFGAGVAAYEVSQAPDAQKPRVAASETGGMVGGAVGGTLGMVGGGLLLGALVSNPVGWAIIGAGLVGGALVGYLGSEGGRAAGGAIYDAVTR
jgi:hypothetical protein